VPVNEAVLFDFSKQLDEIVELNQDERYARVQPGIVLDRLRDAAAEHQLPFGPDPATHSRCTLGGMIGNNSCGTHSILAGATADNIDELDVLLHDGTRFTAPASVDEQQLGRTIAAGDRVGEIYGRLRALRDRYADLIRERYPKIPRRISGYNLDALLPENRFNLAAVLVGTEVTCALTPRALQADREPAPPVARPARLRRLSRGADRVPDIIEFEPIGLETFDWRLVRKELVKGSATTSRSTRASACCCPRSARPARDRRLTGTGRGDADKG
jgi:FAD/FMN-containing dehydrogenase